MCVHCRRRVWYECWLLIECTRRRACHTLPCCALYYVTSILYYMSYSFYTRSLIYWCHILECHIPLILPIDCFCMLVYTMYNRFNGYLQCIVSYAPFYVCNERSAMTSMKYFKVKDNINIDAPHHWRSYWSHKGQQQLQITCVSLDVL